MDMETIVQKQQQTKDCQQILPRCTKHDEFCSQPVPRSQGRIHAERLKTISLHHSYHCFGRKNSNFFFIYTLACNLKGLFTFEIWNVHGKQSMEKKRASWRDTATETTGSPCTVGRRWRSEFHSCCSRTLGTCPLGLRRTHLHLNVRQKRSKAWDIQR